MPERVIGTFSVPPPSLIARDFGIDTIGVLVVSVIEKCIVSRSAGSEDVPTCIV